MDLQAQIAALRVELEAARRQLGDSEQQKAHLIGAMKDNWCLMRRAQIQAETLTEYLLKEEEQVQVPSRAAESVQVLQ